MKSKSFCVAGRGFSVVATEISKLSSQTNGATGEINGIIETIVKSIEDMTVSVEALLESSRLQNQYVDTTAINFEKIHKSTRGIVDQVSALKETVDVVMEENKQNKMDEIEIDIGRIFRAVLDKAWLVAIIAVLCAVLTLVGTLFLITPQYQSTAMFYVNNSNLSLGDASFSISSGDLSTSRNLVDSYIVILNTRASLTEIIEQSGVDLSCESLQKMLDLAGIELKLNRGENENDWKSLK